MFGFQSWTFADTNQTTSVATPIPKPLADLAKRISSADGIIVSNWTDTVFGQTPFTFKVSCNDVAKAIQAVSSAAYVGGQEHPDWEFGWKLMFYHGTNFVAGISCGGSSFLTGGVWIDDTGVLGKICGNASNRQYLARVYGDEDKDFNESIKAEAKEWLKSPLHRVRDVDKKTVRKYANDFYAAGAKRVYVTDIEAHFNGKNPPTETGKYLLVVVPEDEAIRKKIFIVHWEVVKAIGFDGDGDVGQKYSWYPIDWNVFK